MDGLDDVIHRHSVDLIILGTHGKHGLKKLVLGSAAEQIFRKASCPVLAIGPHVQRPPADRRAVQADHLRHRLFRRIAARPALCSLSLAEENQAHLILLHVIPLVPLNVHDQIAASARERLAELIPREAPIGVIRIVWSASSSRPKAFSPWPSPNQPT